MAVKYADNKNNVEYFLESSDLIEMLMQHFL